MADHYCIAFPCPLCHGTTAKPTNYYQSPCLTCDRLRAENAELRQRAEKAEADNAKLRRALGECAAHVGASAMGCSVDFLCAVPEEVAGVVGRLRADLARLTAAPSPGLVAAAKRAFDLVPSRMHVAVLRDITATQLFEELLRAELAKLPQEGK